MEHMVNDASENQGARSPPKNISRSLDSIAVISQSSSQGSNQSTNTSVHWTGIGDPDIADELHLLIASNVDETAFLGGHLGTAQLGSPTATAGVETSDSANLNASISIDEAAEPDLETFINAITPAANLGTGALAQATNVDASNGLGPQDLDQIRRIVEKFSNDDFEVAVALFDRGVTYLIKSTSSENQYSGISNISGSEGSTPSHVAVIVSDGAPLGSPATGNNSSQAHEGVADVDRIVLRRRSMTI